MPELPKSQSGLRKLAQRGLSATKRMREAAQERREVMWEYGGAFFLLPIMRDLTPKLPMLGALDLDDKLQVALVCYIAEEFTDGNTSDAFHGASVGAVGAYSWEQEKILGGLFGE